MKNENTSNKMSESALRLRVATLAIVAIDTSIGELDPCTKWADPVKDSQAVYNRLLKARAEINKLIDENYQPKGGEIDLSNVRV